MNDYIKYVKCYDTLSGKYVMVPVTVELERCIKRSYWKEDMAERRYYKRKVVLDDYKDENIGTTTVLDNMLLNEVLRKETFNELYDAIQRLDERQRDIIRMVYIEEMTLKEAAVYLGISSSYMSRLLKKMLNRLKMILNEIE